MARVVLGFCLFSLGALAAPVVPCAPGTLFDYINLFSDGCTIGDKVFFDFSELTIPTGSTPIDSGTIAVTPVNVPFAPELRFTVNASAVAGQFLDSHFAYSVTSHGGAMIGLTLLTSGALALEDGATTVIEDACLGDVFVFDLCFSSTASLITFATGIDEQASDRVGFAPTFTIGIANDIGVDGGLTGSASLGTVTNKISEMPEPATGLVCAACLAAGAWCSRRRRRDAR